MELSLKGAEKSENRRVVKRFDDFYSEILFKFCSVLERCLKMTRKSLPLFKAAKPQFGIFTYNFEFHF